MAHEIEATDSLILTKHAAWHGLGTVDDVAGTPRELCARAFPWHVEQWPLVAQKPQTALNAQEGGATASVPNKVANVRSDTHRVLGVVGSEWQLYQPIELADFAEALAEGSDVVRCESVGSIRGGAKMWFLLQGESFTPERYNSDRVAPYILLSTGFDGLTPFVCVPTTIRVVCSNTLHAVLRNESRIQSAGYTIRHTGALGDRVAEAQAALRLYVRGIDQQKQTIDELCQKEPSRQELQRFWLECYVKHFGKFAVTPTTPQETKARDKAQAILSTVSANFEKELDLAGPNVWNALNAYTRHIQHGTRYKNTDEQTAAEGKMQSQLFGTGADRSQEALQLALSM